MHRTYVRRRLTLLVAALIAIFGMSHHVAGAIDADPQIVPVSSSSYVVRDGDTMWSIASSLDPGRDPRQIVHELDVLNHGVSHSLVPGQVLSVPSYG
ncbi:MAG: LysM peptidoglycan-binding domain-containing protein [Actinomycetota bacterium]|nr:LysM peptidoglycan-binding domain-containing protein [Actinomycetota bacterium]MDH5223240.1 LysM peptidoglycan-binding domain-containing protein [Actinomycetota bacterium]MDH5312510.1 LysM peptidoglycan-binding domain-containing protein [Actinomycetota bacterium]